MWEAIFLLVSFATGGLGHIERCADEKWRTRLIAYISLSLLIVSLGIQGLIQWQKSEKISDLEAFLKTGDRERDEISGGSIIGESAYLVDDEEPLIFVYNFYEAMYKYDSEIELSTENTPVLPAVNGNPKQPIPCDKGKPDDLEGMAVYKEGGSGEKLYLVTSHSNTKKDVRKKLREMFLEVSLDPNEKVLVKRCVNLREAIEKSFTERFEGISGSPIIEGWKNEDKKLEVMQIEGLAIDKQGYIYLGFRAPLVDKKYALVLRTSIQQVFNGNPDFKRFILDLRDKDEDKARGITSMEFDPLTEKILIVTNSPYTDTSLTSFIWSWEVEEGKVVQNNLSRKGVLFKPFKGINAKPEALLLSQADRITVFFDHKGYGGQQSFTRSRIELVSKQ